MRSDVHFAALRAAAKVAFSVALLGGCSAAAESQDGALADNDEANGDGTESSESAVKSRPGSKKGGSKIGGGRPSGTACHKDAGVALPKPDCKALITAAFGTEEGWPSGEVQASAEVKACCLDAIKASVEGERIPQHWSCCEANNWGQGESDAVRMACTPWGPPVPPSMNRARRRETMPHPWIHEMVA